MSIKEGRWN